MTTHAAAQPQPRASGAGVETRAGITLAWDWELARIAMAVALLTGLVGVAVTVGADSRWLAALGHAIVARHGIPPGVPFAAAPTGHWANRSCSRSWCSTGSSGIGDRGLTLAQLACVAVSLSILGLDARAARAAASGSPGWTVPLALGLAVLGAVASLAIARVQMFSLVLFPGLVALLRAEVAGRHGRSGCRCPCWHCGRISTAPSWPGCFCSFRIWPSTASAATA